jgi:hypothetical protein
VPPGVLRPGGFEGAFRQVRGPHILAMTRWDLPVVQTGLRIVLETPTRFWEGSLILLQEVLSTALAFLKGRRIPHVRYPRFASGPSLWGRFFVQILHLVKPAAHP